MKNKTNIFAIAAVAGAIASLAFTPGKNERADNAGTTVQMTQYWYPVDAATNEIAGPAAYHDTKSNVIASQDCKDQADQPICLFGSDDPSLSPGTDVGTPSESNRILRSN